ncbi:Tox-REase-5 domain-containing protein [Hyalangium versicolor]|uniref:Tox-REase-5 domain-containing protein n=1 Tax=Hyalangium versicolor TaxID=2861190 RepID=UPI001CCFE008|nr:Tox-REase-5 domain-containing protein [Hyalangium versicolor]
MSASCLDVLVLHPAVRWMVLVLAGVLGGCATDSARPFRGGAAGRGGPPAMVARSVLGGLQQMDPFEAVLLFAGLNSGEDLPEREAPFTPEDAARLYDRLLDTPVTLAGFGPRLVAASLLREVMEGNEELSRSALLERVQRFHGLAVLRPDGYLAWALTGETQQRVAPVQWKDGAFRAHAFEVGRFYSGRNGMAFFAVDEQLRDNQGSGVLAEVYDDADIISRSLDGAEQSFVELGLALGALVTRPVHTVAELKHLPKALAALIESSPEYLERFRFMTRGEQIQSLAKLSTTLLSTFGAAGGTTRTVAGVGRGLESVSVPALSLAADGALTVERVAVPAGRVVTALSGGPGAAIILQRANDSASQGQSAPQGPGDWGPSRESMSKRAARYQEQISGHPASEAYWIGGKDLKSGGVKLDGFKDDVLLEAKGPGYANKFADNLKPKKWFAPSGARQLIEQANRQLKAARGIPIRWHVAEKKAADAIRELLANAEVTGIEVVHTPALQ